MRLGEPRDRGGLPARRAGGRRRLLHLLEAGLQGHAPPLEPLGATGAHRGHAGLHRQGRALHDGVVQDRARAGAGLRGQGLRGQGDTVHPGRDRGERPGQRVPSQGPRREVRRRLARPEALRRRCLRGRLDDQARGLRLAEHDDRGRLQAGVPGREGRLRHLLGARPGQGRHPRGLALEPTGAHRRGEGRGVAGRRPLLRPPGADGRRPLHDGVLQVPVQGRRRLRGEVLPGEEGDQHPGRGRGLRGGLQPEGARGEVRHEDHRLPAGGGRRA
mmetsp:Transcript_10302/g.30580  ORF Transcript_10302/g.30580 Transcript_10302/m.30580 type:complete len:273 (+) Transcript_10302:1723-2541(+)